MGLRTGSDGSVAGLWIGAAAMSAAMAMGSAAASVAASDRLGMRWGAAPNTAAIVGTAAGAVVLGRLMRSRGRRSGLAAGYAVAVLGALLAAVSVTRGGVGGLVSGFLLLGVGNAAAQLSRYVAAELAPTGRAGRALGLLVWSATVGAVGGPLLLGPAGDGARTRGLTPDAGPIAVVAACSLLAFGAVLLGVPRRANSTPAAPAGPETVVGRARILGPATLAPLAVMTTGQVVMVLVMTALPVQMHAHGEPLGAIGAVLSAHALGMFAPSPLTGWLVDRLGPRPVMGLGLALLGLAAISGAVVVGRPGQAAALFALGFAWNLCFIGGSAAVSKAVTGLDGDAVEGAVDAGVWTAAAAASLASTLMLAWVGRAGVAAAAVVLILPAVALLGRSRHAQSRHDPASSPVTRAWTGTRSSASASPR